jgi:predicted nucleic acid-binding Zn ribbon protein
VNRELEKLDGLLEKVMGKLGIQKRVDEYRVVEEWSEIVGSAISKRVRPVGVERGVLTVQVDSSSWLMEMRMRSRDLISKIDEVVGKGIVHEIRFIRK